MDLKGGFFDLGSVPVGKAGQNTGNKEQAHPSKESEHPYDAINYSHCY
jgi:hypothetical protein